MECLFMYVCMCDIWNYSTIFFFCSFCSAWCVVWSDCHVVGHSCCSIRSLVLPLQAAEQQVYHYAGNYRGDTVVMHYIIITLIVYIVIL